MSTVLLSIQSAAERLAVDPKTLRRWIRQRAFPVVVLGSSHPNGIRYRIREHDLEAWLEERIQRLRSA